MNEYIKILPGKLLKADGSQTNLLEILGISVTPMTVRNDGYKRPEIAAIVIGKNQYALADILEAIATKLNAPTLPLKLGTLADGDTLVYDGEEEAFVNNAPALPLKLGTLADGDTLVYDGEEEAFVNQAAAE